MDNHQPPGGLVGRREEKAWLTSLLQAAAAGRGTAGVLRGDPGMGKTFLVSAVAAEQPRFRRELIAGVEAEADLPYAALQRLVLAHPAALADLPDAQRTALRTSCGLAAGPPAARSLVGLGLLGLLTGLAEQSPLICFLDDAQWCDAESLDVFAFAARRLLAERIVLLFALRTGIELLADLPSRTLGGLAQEDALTLLATAAPQPVHRRTAQRILMATGGNPLALVDLVGELTGPQLRGEDPLPEPVPLGKRLETHYLGRVRSLPRPTQLWLLTAAVEPDGDPDAVAAAGKSLGLQDDAAEAAELAGLVHVGAGVVFPHPLVRSAICNGASSAELRSVHAHLAQAAERRGDHFRWATHRAAATAGVDDGVADALEEAADAAVRRGGYQTRKNLLTRAAALSSDPAVRDMRLLGAAEAAVAAGSGVQARTLMESVRAERLDAVAQGRCLLVRCEVDVVAPGAASSFPRRARDLLAAARLFRAAAPDRAKQALSQTFWTLVQADELVQGTSSREVAEEARLLCAAHPGPDLPTQSLTLLSTLVLDGHAAAVPLLHRTVRRAAADRTSDEEILRSCLCLAYAAGLLRDPEAGAAIVSRAESIARRRGAALTLCRILLLGAHLDLQRGRIRGSRERLTGAAELMSLMGLPAAYGEVVTSTAVLDGWAGNAAAGRDHPRGGQVRTAGYGTDGAARRIGAMLLRMSQGRYAEAWAAGRYIRHEDPFFAGALYLPDLVECAARAGDLQSASRLLRRFQADCRFACSDWAEGLMERSAAHLAGDGADLHFERALKLLDPALLEMDAARTHLLYGEWLRRRRRRKAAAEHLSAALAAFRQLGATGWAERAGRELAALGAAADRRTPAAPALTVLTPRELSVARLAAAGNTNADIAEQLFVSANTVDYHLRKVFRKLGVTSRRQLRDLDLPDI